MLCQLPQETKWRTADDLPTCLAPRRSRGLWVVLSFHSSSVLSILLLIYFILMPYFTDYQLQRYKKCRNPTNNSWKNVEIRQIILENTSKSDKKLLIMVSVVSLVSVSNAIKTQRHGGTENNNKFSEDTEILSFLKI